MADYSQLPPELLEKILLSLDYYGLKEFCASNSAIQSVCHDDLFWAKKMKLDFPYDYKIIKREKRQLDKEFSWRKEYGKIYKEFIIRVDLTNGKEMGVYYLITTEVSRYISLEKIQKLLLLPDNIIEYSSDLRSYNKDKFCDLRYMTNVRVARNFDLKTIRTDNPNLIYHKAPVKIKDYRDTYTVYTQNNKGQMVLSKLDLDRNFRVKDLENVILTENPQLTTRPIIYRTNVAQHCDPNYTSKSTILGDWHKNHRLYKLAPDYVILINITNNDLENFKLGRNLIKSQKKHEEMTTKAEIIDIDRLTPKKIKGDDSYTFKDLKRMSRVRNIKHAGKSRVQLVRALEDYYYEYES
jgi:hypothetical protein